MVFPYRFLLAFAATLATPWAAWGLLLDVPPPSASASDELAGLAVFASEAEEDTRYESTDGGQPAVGSAERIELPTLSATLLPSVSCMYGVALVGPVLARGPPCAARYPC
jgi:hypothetical protein